MYNSAFFVVLFSFFALASSSWSVGAGIYDITGPASDVGMMGYAMTWQRTAGIHFRLRARAFVIGDGEDSVVYVSTDSCMMFNGIKQEVLRRLHAKGLTNYTDANVMISGKHTHSGPGGYSFYTLLDLTTWGFHRENWEVIVSGITKAIENAHHNRQDANIFLNYGTVPDANINRSPTAYANNPADERARYAHNTDHNITVLRLASPTGTDIGHINFFAVHGTSMNNTNFLISGDNKGYASYSFELAMNGGVGHGPFVAAFGQSNEGDVSPNTRGAFCENGDPCEMAHSTCGGRSEECHGLGPGKTDFESTKIIGTRQFEVAYELHKSAKIPLSPKVGFVHTYVDMSKVQVSSKFTSTGEVEHTCPSALGDAMAAGTTDGPGEFDFKQGSNSTKDNPFWNWLAGFINGTPSPAQKACQHPKPILLDTGFYDYPGPWEPSILPLQIFQLGHLYIVAVPGEFSTMSGRRLRETVREQLIAQGAPEDAKVVISGLANDYSHYITTYEEYQVQRYEGASTLFGPHTLSAYQQEYAKLAEYLAKGQPAPPGPTPPNISADTFLVQPGVIYDAHPIGKPFGTVRVQPLSSYARNTTVVVEFWGADLRNDFMTEGTFLSVELQQGGKWVVVHTDSAWETKLKWKRHLVAESIVTVEWAIETSAKAGNYRIQHFGNAKSLGGTITPFTGTSNTFAVA